MRSKTHSCRFLRNNLLSFCFVLTYQVVADKFSVQTKNAMARMGEREISFELLEALLTYIKSQEIPGAVLVFLPGWNLIFAMMRHLQQHPVFGTSAYSILPLHSQIPREDQRKVFEPVPPYVTKVSHLI